MELQVALRERVVREDRTGVIRRVGAVDLAGKGEEATAAAVVMDYPPTRILEERRIRVRLRFPYVPGLLSFREIPALLRVLQRVRAKPDLLLCDGQGYLHPRRFGLACHLGVLLDCPTVGCGKTLLCGEHEAPGEEPGSWTPVLDGGEIIGAALRTKGKHPLYVSIGHRVSLPGAIRHVLACLSGHRLPEPIRLADRYSRVPPQDQLR